MFFNSLKSKLKKSYTVINKEIQPLVFPNGEPEYIYVGTILNALFKKQDVFKLIQIYASVYTFYKQEIGNSAKTFTYAKKKAAGILSDYDCKTLIALVMLNTTANKATISDPMAKVDEYRRYVNEYLNIVEGIKKNRYRFETEPIAAGTVNSPLLVDGIKGVHDYIEALSIPGIDKISFSRTSALHLTDERCNVSYVIDEYTLKDALTGAEIATLWFNIYGTENTDVQPVCFSDKTPFSASAVAPELFSTAVEQWKSVEGICQTANIPYDHKKLVISTFAYFFTIWTFSFKNIRSGQAMDLEEIYVEKFGQYNRAAFEGFPEIQILEIEQLLKDMLKRVDRRVRASYQANNYTLVDDGLSDEFICEFITSKESISSIKAAIVNIIMNDWVSVGQKADQTYLT